MAALRKRKKTEKQRRAERQPEKGVTSSWKEREDRIGEDGWGVTELKFSKARQARGRLSEA